MGTITEEPVVTTTTCICGRTAWRMTKDSFASLVDLRFIMCGACGHIPVCLPEGEHMDTRWTHIAHINTARKYQTRTVPGAVGTVYRTRQQAGPDLWLWTSEVCLPNTTRTAYFPQESDAKSFADTLLDDFVENGEVAYDENETVEEPQTASEIWRATCLKAREALGVK
jgi:hypothetical protein